MRRLSAMIVVIGSALGGLAAVAQSPTDDAQVRAMKAWRDSTLNQQRSSAVATTNAPAPSPLTLEKVERLYLDGKITARQFEQYVRDYRLVRAKPAPATNQPVQTPHTATAPRTTPPGTNAAPMSVGEGEELAAQNRLAELEAKMDALLQQRTNRVEAPTNATAAGPKTKRERMDDLLRLLIAGKISQAEYNARRAKLIAEPDSDKK